MAAPKEATIKARMDFHTNYRLLEVLGIGAMGVV